MRMDIDELATSIGRLWTVEAYLRMVDSLREEGEVPKWMKTAGAGQNWMDTTPAGVLRPFHNMAYALIGRISQQLKGEDLGEWFERHCQLEGHRRPPTVDDFGSDLAFEVLGSGVAWSDDHPDHGFELPTMEAALYCTPHEGSIYLPMPTELETVFRRHGMTLHVEAWGVI